MIDGKKIERVSHTKFLGVYVDEDLNWKYHTSQISLKVSKCIGVINRVKHVLTRNLLTSLYFSLVNHILFIAILYRVEPVSQHFIGLPA